MPWLFWLAVSLHTAGWVAFAVFYAREEQTTKALIVGCLGVAVALLLAVFLSGLIGGAITVAMTFYVADRKNRSRGWALLAIILGPIALLTVVLLPKQVNVSTLSLGT